MDDRMMCLQEKPKQEKFTAYEKNEEFEEVIFVT